MVKNFGRTISLRHVRAFLEVGEQGSFTVAADRLAISQPALTTTINQMEERLGVALLKRTTRRVELTKIGADFLPVARYIVSDFDRAINAVQAAGERGRHHVAIAVLPSLAMTILPQAIKRFAESHGGIKVDIKDDNAKGVHRQIRLNESDFGLSNQWEEDKHLVFTPVFQDRIGLVCHRNNDLAASGSEVDWMRLADHNFVGMAADTGIHALLHSTPHLPECVLRPEYEVLTMVALATLIHANLGVSALPALALPRLVDPPLEFIPLGNPAVWRQICIVTRTRGQLSTSAESLRAFLQRALQKPWDLLEGAHGIDKENLRS